jgi:serine/threonine-protein kinase
MVYEQVNRYEEAVAEEQKAVSLSQRIPTMLGALGHTYAVSGDTAKAQKALDELMTVSKQRYVPKFAVALVYAGLGDKAQALDWLEAAYEEHSLLLALIKVWPQFDPLRGEPRFQAVVRRMNLEP